MARAHNEVLVIGHRHPDTDAVASALAYAQFYAWRTGERAVACHLDEVAPETAWLLQHLGLKPPRAIADVYLRAADVMELEVPALFPGDTLREAGQLMRQRAVRALPVIDHDARLVGLVEYNTLADRYLDQLQLSQEIDLPVALLRQTLEAEQLSGDPATQLHDQVWFATMSAATTRSVVGNGDVVIVGDQPEVQQAALDAGAGCLILTDNAPLASGLLEMAQAKGATLLCTPHSPFAAALLLLQSLPVSRVMRRELGDLTVTTDALLGDARDQLRRTNLAALAVIDDEQVLRGLVLRRHLAEQSRRRVILTDHNHPDQAAPGVAESQIIAIIDHHNLGGLQTLQPLSMRCDPVGCCCTLIAEEYRQSNAPLDAPLAGLMLGAILSDTVRFRSPTTTPRDQAAAEWLAERSGEGIDDLARQLFRARLPDPIPPPDWWVSRDMKIFEFGSTRLSISQMELASVREVMPPALALREALQRLAAAQQTNTALLLLTDILEGGSVLVAANGEGEAIAARAFDGSFANHLLPLPGVMSRKKQVVPAVAAALTN